MKVLLESRYILISICLFFIFVGCQNDATNKKNLTNNGGSSNRRQNLNISIFLDLSDRISPTIHSNPSMEFYQRDLGYIDAIAHGFAKHLSAKRIMDDNDQLQVFFEPEPLNPDINTLANKLKLSFTKFTTSKASISNISPQYMSASAEIYKLAISQKRYLGSDIWGFMKNKVNDYCVKPNHRNILFILTDGYMYHKNSKFRVGNKSSYLTPELIKSLNLNTSDYKNKVEKNGYSFVKANDNLENLEVVVLGINPAKGNPYEGDVIFQYWNNWLKDMKVKTFVLKGADLPSNLDPIIQTYINPTS